MDTIGSRIRAARKARGLKMVQVALRAQLSPGAISRIERGERSPGSATLALLATALGVDAGELMGDVPSVTVDRDGQVVEAMQLVARVMPGLPEAGRARVLRILRAALD